jgi:hypothetical protein
MTLLTIHKGQKMAYIRVIYRKKASNFDYIPSHVLDLHIRRDDITHFYRPSEKRWVNVRLDPTRGKGGSYRGHERRSVETGKKAVEQRTEEKKTRQATDWLDSLWAQIEVRL